MPFGVGRYRRGDPPAAPGLYRFVNKHTGSVDYVGDAKNLRRRYQEHKRKGKFDPDTHHFDWKKQD